MQVTPANHGVVPLTRSRCGSGHRHLGGALTVAAFLIPAGALYTLFVLFPIVQAGYYSLYR